MRAVIGGRILRDDIKVRMAVDLDGPKVEELADGLGVNVDLDWSRIAPYWLVAEAHGEVVAALQLCMGRPIGWVEQFLVDKELSKRGKVIAIEKLAHAALVLHRQNGAQLVMGVISTDQTEWCEIVKEQFGAQVLNESFVMIRRI